MLSDLNMWNKIGRVVMLLSEQLDVDLRQAFDIFYKSKTCRNLHDASTGLYLMSDRYILEDLQNELTDL
ncbi:MAG: DUF3791 domain-containing protein [Bacteroidaceae bacterium]|nr:DUF3791 domain-containing protein [Bacteroidaceae bacterium]